MTVDLTKISFNYDMCVFSSVHISPHCLVGFNIEYLNCSSNLEIFSPVLLSFGLYFREQ